MIVLGVFISFEFFLSKGEKLVFMLSLIVFDSW